MTNRVGESNGEVLRLDFDCRRMLHRHVSGVAVDSQSHFSPPFSSMNSAPADSNARLGSRLLECLNVSIGVRSGPQIGI
jgi:hypothetical protein